MNCRPCRLSLRHKRWREGGQRKGAKTRGGRRNSIDRFLHYIHLYAREKTMEEAAAPLPTKGRLVIWKLVLENFKSYAGKRVVGPFHKVPHEDQFLDIHLCMYRVLSVRSHVVLHGNRWPERQRQIERHRCPPLRVRKAREAASSGQGERAPPLLGEPSEHPISQGVRLLPRDHRQGRTRHHLFSFM